MLDHVVAQIVSDPVGAPVGRRQQPLDPVSKSLVRRAHWSLAPSAIPGGGYRLGRCAALSALFAEATAGREGCLVARARLTEGRGPSCQDRRMTRASAAFLIVPSLALLLTRGLAECLARSGHLAT